MEGKEAKLVMVRVTNKTNQTYVKDKENFIQHDQVEDEGSFTYRINDERPSLLLKNN